MSTGAIMLANCLIPLTIIAAIISCDSLTESDSIIPEKQVTLALSDHYILPGSSTIIDLESVIKESFSNATISVSENPQRGRLSQVNRFLLKYMPWREFEEGEDHFVLSVVSDGKILAKDTLTIKMKKSKEEFPCDLIVVEDKLKLKAGSSPVSIGILENDWLCEIDKSNVRVSIATQPEFGRAIIDNESIIYTPDAEYKDHDELIYKLTRSTGEVVSYGLISFRDHGQVKMLKIPDKTFRSLFFLDESTGFLVTNDGVLYKTSDGGTNWKVMVSEGFYHDIFFFDAQIGFAPYGTGFMTTKDGGVTWKDSTHLDKGVTSVVFTSEATGFIIVNDGWQSELEGWGDVTPEVLKTEDGGVTWRTVLAYPSVSEGIDIEFINSTTGYVFMSERIWVTKDSGETWDVFLDLKGGNFQVTGANKIFAVLYGQRTIVTSQNASDWRPVAHFSHKIGSFGFSPSGEVGFAIMPDDHEPQNDSPYLQSVSIFKTVDSGETWVEVHMDEALYGAGGISLPSNDVAYFLCSDRIYKYSNK
jgi:hypothetical protein